MNKFVRWIEDSPARHRAFVVLCLLGLVVALLLVSGCSGGDEDQEASEKPSDTPSLDAGAQEACDLFATWWADGHPDNDREGVLNQVHISASNSNVGLIDDKAERLFRVGNDTSSSDHAFQLVADAFAYECTVQGWTA